MLKKICTKLGTHYKKIFDQKGYAINYVKFYSYLLWSYYVHNVNVLNKNLSEMDYGYFFKA